jgi:hypothetical protein
LSFVGQTRNIPRYSGAAYHVFALLFQPFWDDGDDIDGLYDGVDDEDMPVDPYPAIVNRIPDDDELLVNITKRWVQGMMSDMGICPFSPSAERAGLPVGNVFYCVDRATSMEDMYARYWKEVVRIEQNPEKEISTTLLIAPEFCIDNVELFESFSNTLTQPLAALGVDELMQLIFFHPQWVFRDGDARAGEQQAANYARRSPWPMINLLRTTQVRAAQKGIPTGLVYKQNEKTLSSVGVKQLETMLRLRDWSALDDFKVNRREVDALKIAQDFQQTGKVRTEDMRFEYDNTPAAQKVDRSQVEQGNLVRVIQQALEKRLGKTGNQRVSPLSGPETSATAMAADFLIQELRSMFQESEADGGTADAGPADKSSSVAVAVATPSPAGRDAVAAPLAEDVSDAKYRREREARVEAQREEARTAIFTELREVEQEAKDAGKPQSRGFGDPISDVLFGRGGIPDKDPDLYGSISDNFDPTNI